MKRLFNKLAALVVGNQPEYRLTKADALKVRQSVNNAVAYDGRNVVYMDIATDIGHGVTCIVDVEMHAVSCNVGFLRVLSAVVTDSHNKKKTTAVRLY